MKCYCYRSSTGEPLRPGLRYCQRCPSPLPLLAMGGSSVAHGESCRGIFQLPVTTMLASFICQCAARQPVLSPARSPKEGCSEFAPQKLHGIEQHQPWRGAQCPPQPCRCTQYFPHAPPDRLTIPSLRMALIGSQQPLGTNWIGRVLCVNQFARCQ